MRTIQELAAEGLRGEALTDALYQDMFGHPPPKTPPTPEERQRSWEQFLSLMDTFTPEELNDGFMDHRKHLREEDESFPDVSAA